MTDTNADRAGRAEHALRLYEAIQAIAADQDDPRWGKAAILLRELENFGPPPEVPLAPYVAHPGATYERKPDSSPIASDRQYDGYAE